MTSKSVIVSAILLFGACSVQALEAVQAPKDLEEEVNTRSIFASDNGQLFIALNDTTLILGFIALAALAAVLYFAVTYSAAEPAYDRFYYDPYAQYQYQHYYDPDLIAADSPYADAALAYAVSAHQRQQQEGAAAQRAKRSPVYFNNLATKMSQLEHAFKKFEVESEECQMFVACEAAQIRKLEKNVPVVRIVNGILSAPGYDSKVNPQVMDAFRFGQTEHQKGNLAACAPLRAQCYKAHNQLNN